MTLKNYKIKCQYFCFIILSNLDRAKKRKTKRKSEKRKSEEKRKRKEPKEKVKRREKVKREKEKIKDKNKLNPLYYIYIIISPPLTLTHRFFALAKKPLPDGNKVF